jgi:hypothetical protein
MQFAFRKSCMASTLCNMVLQTQLHNLACYCHCHWQVYLYPWLMMQWLQSLYSFNHCCGNFLKFWVPGNTLIDIWKLWEALNYLSSVSLGVSKIEDTRDSMLKAKSLMISWCVLMDSSSLGVIIMPKMEALIIIWHRDLRAGIQISNGLWLLCMLLDVDDECSF